MLWGTKLNIATNDGENKAYQIPSRMIQDIEKKQALSILPGQRMFI